MTTLCESFWLVPGLGHSAYKKGARAGATIYRSLIRSVIDYGAIAYDNASESQLAKLDSIQYQALKISTGAMVVTPLATLQVHCEEPPLQLRRLKQQIQYAIKVRSSTNHVAKSVFIIGAGTV